MYKKNNNKKLHILPLTLTVPYIFIIHICGEGRQALPRSNDTKDFEQDMEGRFLLLQYKLGNPCSFFLLQTRKIVSLKVIFLFCFSFLLEQKKILSFSAGLLGSEGTMRPQAYLTWFELTSHAPTCHTQTRRK